MGVCAPRILGRCEACSETTSRLARYACGRVQRNEKRLKCDKGTMMKSPSDNAASPGGAGRSERARSESETSAKPATGGAARPPDPGESSIVLATFPSAGAAERTVMQLGRAFRNMARRGHADAFVVTGDEHGSFSLVQSRVVTASGLVGAVMRVSASVMVGFHGLVSALRGARTGATAVRSHGRRVGSGADRARELLGQAGEHGAGLVNSLSR